MKHIKVPLVVAALTCSFVGVASAATPLEPATQKFIDGLAAAGGPPIYTLTPDQARKVLDDAQSGPVNVSAAHIEDRTIPVGPKGTTRIRIIRPDDVGGVSPVVMYYHGAGWVMGDVKTHDRLVRELANGTKATVVFVDYDRSPEAQYPIAIEEDYAATKYVAEHAKELNVDASRMAIAGDSVGGNMVAVVSLLDKERKGPAIKAQLLFYPVTDASMSDVSYAQFADGPWLTKAGMKWFWNAYLPDVSKRMDPHVSPLNASLEQLSGLPPALIITDENDVLRDEGEAYARKLSEAGVRVTSTRYSGTIHDFVMLNALADTPAARAATQEGIDFLKEHLH
ncbi:alpha/beta hydrolase [Dyella humicola]|uniref:alpha/beta hydrolase n=1 Tax=Dyella humicola TaxID=2992126 RepID=UPI002255DF71|nr:alpha/beta hydrolase [Dyella humicola]